MREMECVLIVDDEESIRWILGEICRKNHIPFVEADCGNAAYELMLSNNITAVISDLNMPNGTGHEFLRKIRQRGFSTPVAFITAYDTKAHLHESLQLGATDFIAKPFQVDEVEKTLFKLIALGKALPDSATFLRKTALFQGSTTKKE